MAAQPFKFIHSLRLCQVMWTISDRGKAHLRVNETYEESKSLTHRPSIQHIAAMWEMLHCLRMLFQETVVRIRALKMRMICIFWINSSRSKKVITQLHSRGDVLLWAGTEKKRKCRKEAAQPRARIRSVAELDSL